MFYKEIRLVDNGTDPKFPTNEGLTSEKFSKACNASFRSHIRLNIVFIHENVQFRTGDILYLIQ